MSVIFCSSSIRLSRDSGESSTLTVCPLVVSETWCGTDVTVSSRIVGAEGKSGPDRCPFLHLGDFGKSELRGGCNLPE